jgi:uncharacterized protein (TIGR03435 family)
MRQEALAGRGSPCSCGGDCVGLNRGSACAKRRARRELPAAFHASVREDKTGAPSHSNFSLDNGNAWFTVSQKDVLAPNGTLFSAISVPLLHYITFAYKLSGTEELALRMDYWAGLDLHVPDWVRNDRYDIEARTSEPATKDQMRLMM